MPPPPPARPPRRYFVAGRGVPVRRAGRNLPLPDVFREPLTEEEARRFESPGAPPPPGEYGPVDKQTLSLMDQFVKEFQESDTSAQSFIYNKLRERLEREGYRVDRQTYNALLQASEQYGNILYMLANKEVEPTKIIGKINGKPVTAAEALVTPFQGLEFVISQAKKRVEKPPVSQPSGEKPSFPLFGEQQLTQQQKTEFEKWQEQTRSFTEIFGSNPITLTYIAPELQAQEARYNLAMKGPIDAVLVGVGEGFKQATGLSLVNIPPYLQRDEAIAKSSDYLEFYAGYKKGLVDVGSQATPVSFPNMPQNTVVDLNRQGSWVPLDSAMNYYLFKASEALSAAFAPVLLSKAGGYIGSKVGPRLKLFASKRLAEISQIRERTGFFGRVMSIEERFLRSINRVADIMTPKPAEVKAYVPEEVELKAVAKGRQAELGYRFKGLRDVTDLWQKGLLKEEGEAGFLRVVSKDVKLPGGASLPIREERLLPYIPVEEGEVRFFAGKGFKGVFTEEGAFLRLNTEGVYGRVKGGSLKPIEWRATYRIVYPWESQPEAGRVPGVTVFDFRGQPYRPKPFSYTRVIAGLEAGEKLTSLQAQKFAIPKLVLHRPTGVPAGLFSTILPSLKSMEKSLATPKLNLSIGESGVGLEMPLRAPSIRLPGFKPAQVKPVIRQPKQKLPKTTLPQKGLRGIRLPSNMVVHIPEPATTTTTTPITGLDVPTIEITPPAITPPPPILPRPKPSGGGKIPREWRFPDIDDIFGDILSGYDVVKLTRPELLVLGMPGVNPVAVFGAKAPVIKKPRKASKKHKKAKKARRKKRGRR